MARPLSTRELRTKAILDGLHDRYHRAELLGTDPLCLVHRYTGAEDREIVALLAAAFASGNIKSIIAALERLLAPMGAHPAAWLREHPPAELAGRFPGFVHRWVREVDAEILCAHLGGALRRHGSLGALWRAVDDPAEPDTLNGLGNFVEAILAEPVDPLARRERRVERADGSSHGLRSVETILLTNPRNGSACKRMHLFLRWMARPDDGIDLGLWSDFLSPSRLLIPVDTHVLKQSQRLGLTKAKLPTARAAEEITRRLRRLDPEDPIRYDFALVRAGIAELRGSLLGE
ncbi:TIGR02757 family protein [bacterium]|nr:TIGR02757 family protein [bacterium]